ncbi:MAG: aldo/keto reductase [Lachnospiraceae bacterium]|nr:aldo/keto reductase [Lachnospiraceae bacterium]
MKKKILGKDLEVSAVGYGCMGLSHAYGNATAHNEAVKIIRSAYENGYTFFDTARCYVGTEENGAISDNEELVGEALKDVRNHVVIATKFGVNHSTDGLVTDSRPDSIRKSVEVSLKRLNVEHIDLYYQHRIDLDVPIEEVAGLMSELIDEGKITHWGMSEADEEHIRRAHTVCPVTAIQNRYSMMSRWHESLFSVLEELNIGFVAFSPLANGILSDAYTKEDVFDQNGDYRRLMPQFQSESYGQNEELLNLIRRLAEENNATPSQIALSWMIQKKPYIVPIPGTRNMERLKENLGAANVNMTPAQIEQIDTALNQMKMSEVFGGSKILK